MCRPIIFSCAFLLLCSKAPLHKDMSDGNCLDFRVKFCEFPLPIAVKLCLVNEKY